MTYRVLNREENHIITRIMGMSDLVYKSILSSMQCLGNHDLDSAKDIIANDVFINRNLHEIEQECCILIARQQPVARDLRTILSDMVVAMELERIADYAEDIARIVMQMNGPVKPDLIEHTNKLVQKCLHMFVDIMAAYKVGDAEAARRIAALDDEVDADERKVTAICLDSLCKDADDHALLTDYAFLLRILHDIERIGDRVTNIAERIVFIVTGEAEDLNQ